MRTPNADKILSALHTMTDDLTSKLQLRGVHPFQHLRMPGFRWPELRIGEKVARIPVVQGGMGVGISLSGLASAVANVGGIGVIAANAIGMIEKDYFADGRAANLRALRNEIRAARKKTNGLIGVNIMVAVNDFHALLDVAIEEQVDIVFMGAGLPVKGIPVDRMRANGVKAAPIVSSARAAELIFRMWKKSYGDVPDAVVCEGPRAGGHLGFSVDQIDDPEYQLDHLVPEIVDALRPYEEEFGRDIPLIAAGGIYTGEDIHTVMTLGAAAVQMATRFVATHECDAAQEFKQAYVECTADQIGLIKSPVGMPGRAIRNQFIENSERGDAASFRCAWKCLASCDAESAKYCISVALNNARKGRMDRGFVFVGSNAYRVTEIVPVAALTAELAEGYRETARAVAAARLEGMVKRIKVLRRRLERLGGRRSEQVAVRLEALRHQIVETLAESWRMLTGQLREGI